ncbi:OsmC family protein [Pseudomonas sp. GOM7]|uniref:OsmC family protein n=1 Tax=unclassified Pseudomonas TaxID=196821 RepID=UPI00227BB961|nr:MULTISPECIES: OsmC family protein [unclassified Pseudomonas]WAJ35572.1 OsmC family protein [Pseudomonas sp. GOM7]
MIRIHSSKGLQQQISIDAHQLLGDVAPELGGDGAGPDPHDLFDASLGTCKAMTLLLYARQRGLPLEGIDVSVERDDSEEREGNYHLIVELSLKGPLDEAQRQQLLRIADKCPIHKLMTSTDIQIETRLTGASA